MTKKSVFFHCIEILTHETLVHTDFLKKMNFHSYSFPFAFCNNYLLSLFLFMQSAFVYTSLPKSNYGLLFTSFEVYFEMKNRDNKSIVVLNYPIDIVHSWNSFNRMNEKCLCINPYAVCSINGISITNVNRLDQSNRDSIDQFFQFL